MSKTAIGTLLSCLLLTGSARATPRTTVSRQPGYYAGTGGEFTLMANAPLGIPLVQTGRFETFCLERTEAMTLGASYDVQLNTEALRGGRSDGAPGPGGGGPRHPHTAYLYTQFATGTLADYDYTPGAGRSGSARPLQEVIRYRENEAGKTWSAGSLHATFYADVPRVVAAGRGTGLGHVWALKVYGAGGGGGLQYRAQDMLDTVPAIPAPGAVLLTSLGASLVGWLRRRRIL